MVMGACWMKTGRLSGSGKSRRKPTLSRMKLCDDPESMKARHSITVAGGVCGAWNTPVAPARLVLACV